MECGRAVGRVRVKIHFAGTNKKCLPEHFTGITTQKVMYVMHWKLGNASVTKCLECIQGHDPVNLFFLVVFSLYLLGRSSPNYPKC